MAGSKKVIQFFYDVVSPYSWLAFEVLCRYRNVWNIDLRLRPSFLGGVMKESGNSPPGLVPNKFAYIAKDLTHLSRYFGVPLSYPENPFEVMFEKGTLPAMRLITAVSELQPSAVEPLSRELWTRIWGLDLDITERQSLTEAALKAGLSASQVEELFRLVGTKEVKDKLKSTTQEAIDYGAFGFPLSVCSVKGSPEVFFGSDRFELMAHCLGEKWVGPRPDTPTMKM
ncbi:glutathione S-transferase kappa 1 isoform X1 [Amia ocellicauda]|uniref:glutathione S-transferase kappa 1 isoform X1 n=1 Tax=Amia ocellicauda TaxID=2972642 RepID=UPI003463C1EF